MSSMWRGRCGGRGGRGAIAALMVAISGVVWAVEPPPVAVFEASQGIHTTDADLSRRLAALCEALEKKRIEQHIPGMSLAVVRGNQVLMARGFGHRNIEKGQPADEHTIYAIGSQTKAFTSMLVSLLADEGKMSWDDPVRKHVPDFHLFDKDADAGVLMRDLCSHRTGLPRTDLLWASGRASKQEMMERLAFAEPTAKFRAQWQYNNTMFMVAGMAAGNAAGSTWPDLIRDRIFTPLGMKDSSTHISVMQKHPDFATGYAWDADRQETSVLPMREVTCDGAGAINSSVVDMSAWLRMLLSKGMAGTRRFVSEPMLAEMWHRQISMGGDAGYGLGWMLRSWNGKRQVDHGGNIDGFFTTCALLPDDDVGFVLMGSLTYASLQGECLPMVWEAFFPPAPSAEGSMSEAQLQAYTGTYRFDAMGVDCKVNIKDGKLHFDVPGQMNYELKWPDAEGKWVFAMTDAIKLRFNRNAAGEIESLTSFQGGLEMPLLKLGADGAPTVKSAPGPFTMEQLREFTGTYFFEPAKQEWKVIINKGKLAVDVPQQMKFELAWPDEQGRWDVVVAPGAMACAFNRNAEGKIESMSWFQGAEMKLNRTADGPGADLPTIDQVNALRRKSSDPVKLRAMGDIEVTGTVRVVNQGVTGTVRGLANADGRTLQDIDFGVFGGIRVSFDGQRAWTESVGEPFKELVGDRLEEIRKAGSQFVISDLESLFDTVEVVEKTTLDGKEVVVIRGRTAKPDKTVTQYLDSLTGLPLKEENSVLIPGLGRLPMTVTYSDYKDVEGVMVPTKVSVASEAAGAMEYTLVRIEPRATLGADAYVLKPSRPSGS